MNLLKKYKEQIEAAVVLGCLPGVLVLCYAFDICKHC